MFHALLSEGECSGASSFSDLPEVLADDDAVLPTTLGFPADLEVLQTSFLFESVSAEHDKVQCIDSARRSNQGSHFCQLIRAAGSYVIY